MIVTITITRCGVAPPRPRRVSLGQKSQYTGDGNVAKFGIKFNFPTPGSSDVVTRELTITKNGGDPPEVRTYPTETTVTDEMVFDAGDKLSLTLVDVDGAANRSQASAAFVYEVVDDVPPPQPGNLGVAEKRQIN